PIAAPDSQQWSQITAASDEYRHVSVTGTFLYALTVRVKAVTELGGGFWLLTPLQSEDGSVVLVNRGFVPTKAGAQYDRPDYVVPGDVTVTGLLRMTEPSGGFLRDNDPAANLWYSRDVAAIAAARGLSKAAPYFVDADAAKSASGLLSNYPIGGMTVIAFKNNHLVYALTWYALALMVAGVCFWLMRDKRRLLRDDDR
ncbi:MAG: SURF1 family protein, partial [Glaciimonas sp.]|nr:SURF1 family protein [Glaciimonas sp.]